MTYRPAVCVECDSVEPCKHDDGTQHGYTVELRHPDGRTKLHRNRHGEQVIFEYEDRNWACDCNRRLDWHRSTVTEEAFNRFMALPCYGQASYGVRIRNAEGVVVYEDHMGDTK